MTISKGDRLPDVTLVKATENGPEKVQTGEYFAGKKVALFSVPGAFTPTCSARHLPSYVEKAGELKAKGVDEIVGTAVNDAFVMGAWNKASGSSDITMLARPALFDDRQRRGGRGDQRRAAGRFQGQQRGAHARPALTRRGAPRGAPLLLDRGEPVRLGAH